MRSSTARLSTSTISLLYVTTEGDHLRSYLENIKAPFENDDGFSQRPYTAFAHNIRLVDGVYLQESVMLLQRTSSTP